MSNQFAANPQEHQGEEFSLTPVRVSVKSRIGYPNV